jgi:hypothetical protein
MDTLKAVLSNAIVIWILGIGGSVLATLGVSATSVTEIVTGVVGVVLAWIGHAIGLKTALNTLAPGQRQ